MPDNTRTLVSLCGLSGANGQRLSVRLLDQKRARHRSNVGQFQWLLAPGQLPIGCQAMTSASKRWPINSSVPLPQRFSPSVYVALYFTQYNYAYAIMQMELWICNYADVYYEYAIMQMYYEYASFHRSVALRRAEYTVCPVLTRSSYGNLAVQLTIR